MQQSKPLMPRPCIADIFTFSVCVSCVFYLLCHVVKALISVASRLSVRLTHEEKVAESPDLVHWLFMKSVTKHSILRLKDRRSCSRGQHIAVRLCVTSGFLSRVSILLLTRDIDIAILSVRLSVCLSVTRCMKTA